MSIVIPVSSLIFLAPMLRQNVLKSISTIKDDGTLSALRLVYTDIFTSALYNFFTGLCLKQRHRETNL